MRRRSFLGLVGGASAATIVSPMILRRAQAAFGEFPPGSSAARLPSGMRAKRVLEVFLYGGLSPWETLYFVRGRGQADSKGYYALASQNMTWTGNCGGSDVDRTIGEEPDGTPVELGPFAHKLWQRQDIVARMRIVAQSHALEPHEAAVPQALTGRPVGQPTAAGLGTHIQRARIELDGTGRASPYSYVFATGGISSDNIAAAAAAGSHPGSARPLMIKTDNTERLTQLLTRPGVGEHRTEHDALVAAYSAQYGKRLTWPRHGRVRATKVDDFDVAFETATRVDAIRNVLPDITRVGGESCGDRENTDIPVMALDAARRLLTNPDEPAAYVCVSDTGLYEASGGGGYDTHNRNAEDTATNFNHILESLLAIINPPGVTDPTKLSLDDTLIILNTEFGRTPFTQNGDGRNHHPYGYATAFIGGPTVKGIAGHIDDTFVGKNTVTPAQNRIAALLACGIWPFAHEGFAVSDVPGARSEDEAAVLTLTHALGVTL